MKEDTVKRSLVLDEWNHYYEHSFVCDNCHKYQSAYVLMKTRLKGLGIDCEKCGCFVRFSK